MKRSTRSTQATISDDARLAAPGDLRVVEDFINTVDLVTGADELSEPWKLKDWLVRYRLLGETPLDDSHLEQACRLRQALRALAAGNSGSPVGDDVVAVLDRAAQRAEPRMRFGHGGTGRYEPAVDSFENALGQILAAVIDAQKDGSWSRFKRCGACHRAFYDHSRAHTGKWCRPGCGGRVRGRAFRRRGGGPLAAEAAERSRDARKKLEQAKKETLASLEALSGPRRDPPG